MAKSKSAAPTKSVNKSAANPNRQNEKTATDNAVGKKSAAPKETLPPPGNAAEEATKGEAISNPMSTKVQEQGSEGD